MPKSVLRKLLPRRDNQINYLELAAVILAFTTFQGWLTQAAWTAWVDNQGILGAILKGGARASDVNAVIGQLWLNIAKLGIALQIGEGPQRLTLHMSRLAVAKIGLRNQALVVSSSEPDRQ